MVQILQRNPTWQEQLGAGLGSGLSSGLQQLASLKLAQMQQAQKAQQIGKAYKAAGLPENLAYLPEEAQKAIFKGLGERGGLEFLLGGEAEQQQGPQQQSYGQQLAQQLAPQQQAQPSLQQMLQTANPQQLMELLNLGTAMGGMPQEQQSMQQESQQKFAPEQIQPEAAKPTIAQKPKTLADILKQPTKKELTEQRKEQFAREKEAAKEQIQIDKETLPFYNEIKKEAQGAKNSQKKLNRMEELIKRGNLPASSEYRLFKDLSETGISEGSGIVSKIVGLLTRPVGGLGLAIQRKLSKGDLEEFEKLSQDYIKNVKNYFPGRVTNTELQEFLKTIPTLLQTDAGKMAIIQNMRDMDKIALLKEQAAEQIIAENNGRRPRGFQELVDKRIKKEVDKIGDEFVNRVNKPIQYYADTSLNPLKFLYKV